MIVDDIDHQYKIENIVGTSRVSNIDLELDLEGLIEKFEDKEVFKAEKAEKQPGVTVVRDEENPTIIIYESGKYMIVGANSMEGIKEENDWVIDTMEEFGHLEDKEVAVDNFSIENVLVMGILDYKINLTELYENGLDKDKTDYTPEQFPSIFYDRDEYPCTFSIFKSGKIISVGSDDINVSASSLDEFINNEFIHLVQENDEIIMGEKEEEENTATIEDLKEVSNDLGLTIDYDEEDEEDEEEEDEDEGFTGRDNIDKDSLL